MSVHWGGRGPGHTSRRTKKPGGALPLPTADSTTVTADSTAYTGDKTI